MPTAGYMGPAYWAGDCRLGNSASFTNIETMKASPVNTQNLIKRSITPLRSYPYPRFSMPPPTKEYEFFVTTDEPRQPEGSDRGLIRRLVMRDYFDTKDAGSQGNKSEHSSATTVLAKEELTSRFRLAKTEGTSRRQKRGEGNDTTSRKMARAARNVSDGTERSRTTKGGTSLAGRPSGFLIDEDSRSELGELQGHDVRIVLRISPSAHRFDPFDVLPVPGTPQLDTLFKLCKPSLRLSIRFP